ncbi:hypothetical protein Taro_016844 [Colocasia esculenta]|uniref:Uncharacterized protein n=1 Tax=Colocasia esculenta TaxID=4460 RepID=A0A843UU78_COLES|nr:hypothetical protein [Colocasia esculenta]
MESLLLLPPAACRAPLSPASARSCGGSHSVTRLPAHTTPPPPFRAVRLLGPRCRPRRSPLFASYQEKPGGAEDAKGIIQELRVPDSWLVPSKALEESEWLRVSLHKWLDDEYCPEPMNIEISKVAAWSYYNSLAAKETEMGEILLKMIRDLQSLSYQESFHGAFSAANAAINLITIRTESSQ